MKNLLALVAVVLTFAVGTASAQSTAKKEKTKVKTEQTASKENGKSCCAAHGTTTEASASDAGAKTASTTHEHGGKVCDPAHCTEADKKSCDKAHGKSCCMGTAAATDDKKEMPKK